MLMTTAQIKTNADLLSNSLEVPDAVPDDLNTDPALAVALLRLGAAVTGLVRDSGRSDTWQHGKLDGTK